MSKLPKSVDEELLSWTTSVKKTQAASLTPFCKTEIVEPSQVFSDDERREAVLEAFLEHNESADTPVAVLERMDFLKAHVKVEDVSERLVSMFRASTSNITEADSELLGRLAFNPNTGEGSVYIFCHDAGWFIDLSCVHLDMSPHLRKLCRVALERVMRLNAEMTKLKQPNRMKGAENL